MAIIDRLVEAFSNHTISQDEIVEICREIRNAANDCDAQSFNFSNLVSICASERLIEIARSNITAAPYLLEFVSILLKKSPTQINDIQHIALGLIADQYKLGSIDIRLVPWLLRLAGEVGRELVEKSPEVIEKMLLANIEGSGAKVTPSDLMAAHLSTLWKAAGESGQRLAEIVTRLQARLWSLTGENERIQSLHILTATFKANTEMGVTIINQEGWLEDCLDCLEFETERWQLAVLELFSACCLHSATRKRLGALCLPYLQQATQKSPALKSASSLLLSKLECDNNSDVFAQLCDCIMNDGADERSLMNALEGLAMQSRSGQVKERMVGSEELMQRIFKLSDCNILHFSVAAIIYNLVKFKERQSEEEKQIQKLREYSQGLLGNEKCREDEDEAVMKRISILARLGAIKVLVKLTGSNSNSSSRSVKELVAHSLLSFGADKSIRGLLVACGAVKALLSIWQTVSESTATQPSENTPALAVCQALARIAISLDPAVAFRSSASHLVRPLLFLAASNSQLQQFESLLAITNLASMDDESVVSCIFHANGVRVMEELQFSENYRVQCAATEALCNMMNYSPVAEMYSTGKGSRLQMMVALSNADNFETRRAASGSLAILSCFSQTACEAIARQKNIVENMCNLLTEDCQLQHRAIEVLRNISTCAAVKESLMNRRDSICALLKSPSAPIQSGAAETLQNIIKH